MLKGYRSTDTNGHGIRAPNPRWPRRQPPLVRLVRGGGWHRAGRVFPVRTHRPSPQRAPDGAGRLGDALRRHAPRRQGLRSGACHRIRCRPRSRHLRVRPFHAERRRSARRRSLRCRPRPCAPLPGHRDDLSRRADAGDRDRRATRPTASRLEVPVGRPGRIPLRERRRAVQHLQVRRRALRQHSAHGPANRGDVRVRARRPELRGHGLASRRPRSSGSRTTGATCSATTCRRRR